MSKKYFGTDGIRGKVNQGNINGEMFFKFGLAAGTYFKNLKKKKTNSSYCKRYKIVWLYFRTCSSVWFSFSRNACLYTGTFANQWSRHVDKKNEGKYGHYDNSIS